MDPEVIDTVTADSLEEGDLIRMDDEFLVVTNVEDKTDWISVIVQNDGEPMAFDPDYKVEIYAYPAVEL